MKWLRDNLKLIKEVSDSSEIAQTADEHGEVYLVPAFSGLYAPYWRKDARRYIGLHFLKISPFFCFFFSTSFFRRICRQSFPI